MERTPYHEWFESLAYDQVAAQFSRVALYVGGGQLLEAKAFANTRLDKQNGNLQRISECLDTHRDRQVKTQTLVEVGKKDIADLKASF